MFNLDTNIQLTQDYEIMGPTKRPTIRTELHLSFIRHRQLSKMASRIIKIFLSLFVFVYSQS